MTDEGRAGLLRATMSLAGAALLALATNGCSDEPTEVNSLTASLPLADLVVHDTTITATGSTTYKRFVVMDGPLNLVGKTGNYTAITALTFYPSLFPVRDTAAIYSAKLKLRCVSWFGDSSGQFSFSVYRIVRGWYQTTITWDTLQAGFYEATPHGTLLTGAGPDTQVVTVVLDTALVREWFKTPASTDTRFGVVLAPNPGCSIVRGFTAFDFDSTQFQPKLEIIAGSPTGPQRDTTVYSQGIDTFAGNIDNLNSNPQLVYVQAGVDYRSTLTFDVSFVPRGAVINSAELRLQRDPATSRMTRFVADTAFMAQTTLSTATPPVLDGTPSTGQRKAGTSQTFAVDIRRSVQIWVRGPNYGVTLRPSSAANYSSFELLTFWNEKTVNPADRPKLKIVYSTTRQGTIR